MDDIEKPQNTHNSNVFSEINKKNSLPSPYKDGKKDKNFINPSLISHDVFYNLDYPKPDKSIPYCRKKQSVTDKITNSNHHSRALTPQPSRGSPMKSEYNEPDGYNRTTTPMNNNQQFIRNRDNPVFKSQKILHIEDYKANEKINENLHENANNLHNHDDHDIINHNNHTDQNQENHEINENPIENPDYRYLNRQPNTNEDRTLKTNKLEIVKPIKTNQSNINENHEINKPIKTNQSNVFHGDGRENTKQSQNNVIDDKISEKSNRNSTISSFTRNKDNLICDYCINQDLINRKKQDKELEDRRNKQIQQLNENFYITLQHENLMKQTERKQMLRDTREAQIQTIESKKNNHLSQRNFMINQEKEVNQAKEEENRMIKIREYELEREKKQILKKELENQINYKKKEKDDYLTDRNSSKDIALNINNQYYNPYLPNQKEYIEEIERQKQINKEKGVKEKEDSKRNYLYALDQKKIFENEQKKQEKEEFQRKQLYAQKILQDIDDRKKREQNQKEQERSFYKNLNEKINQEEKNLTLQQFYEKKMKEARIAKSLKDQMDEKKNFNMNSQNDERLKNKLQEIEDILAAQKLKIYNCNKCHKTYPKTLLNKCIVNHQKP